MSGLSSAETDAYQTEGYVIPDFRLTDAEVDRLRATIDQMIIDNPDVRPEHLINAHLAQGSEEGVKGADEILELTRHPAILDQVESVLGPDIVLWGCHVFCKPAGNGMEVPWHQDGHYWPIRPLANCTVWIAIDDSKTDNGCLRVMPGSHKPQTLFDHHTDEREQLTLSQAVNSEHMDNYEAADVELDAGQMSLHDVYLIHGSEPNTSTRRRAGIALRYMPATSVFERGVIEAGDSSGLKVDFSKRPLWLVRGKDVSGKNDFEVGH